MRSGCVLGRHITGPDFHFRKMVLELPEGNGLMGKGADGGQLGGCPTNPGEGRQGLDLGREVVRPEGEATPQIFRKIGQDWCLTARWVQG